MMAALQLVLLIALVFQFCEAQQQGLVSFTFRMRTALILIRDFNTKLMLFSTAVFVTRVSVGYDTIHPM